LRTIVQEGRNVFTSLGDPERLVTSAELEKRMKFRRSLVTRRALPAGHLLTNADLDAKRPGTGVSPDEMKYVLGRKIAQDMDVDQVIHWEDLA
jgi:N-acetylneuraminate synthase